MSKEDIENFRGYYTGVGSRETPLHVLFLMSKIAMIFEKKGFILRSGCATGADAAFEDALEYPDRTAEIYIPNEDFPINMGTTKKAHYLIPMEIHGKGSRGLYRQAMRLIHEKKIHKAWENCSGKTIDLHNRNMFQVLGVDLKTKSNFTICYTSGGEKVYADTKNGTGGTATAINASDIFGLEVFNLGKKEDYLRLLTFVEKNEQYVNYDRLNKMVVRSSLNPQKKSYEDLMPIINKEEARRFPELKNTSKKLKL